jgi:hypothetical protein
LMRGSLVIRYTVSLSLLSLVMRMYRSAEEGHTGWPMTTMLEAW